MEGGRQGEKKEEREGGWKVGEKDTTGLDLNLVQCNIILETNRVLNEILHS
jgi:hypothetical protein